VRAAAVTLIVALAVAGGPVAAHQHHARHAAAADSLPADSLAALAADSLAARSGALDSLAARAAPVRIGSSRFVMPGLREALVEHPHNKLVHFPIALALAAALLTLLSRRRPELEPGTRVLVWLAALGAVIAYFTGRYQLEAFAGEPKEWIAEVHERWGTATAIGLLLWAAACAWRPARRHAWILALLVAALVLVTAFYGGLVAHGE
jgi:uncharacterized membrane protein